jgi:hypothetical protein
MREHQQAHVPISLLAALSVASESTDFMRDSCPVYYTSSKPIAFRLTPRIGFVLIGNAELGPDQER